MVPIDTQEVNRLSPYPMAFCCTVQVLVLDNQNGPAYLLIDTISKLFEARISITLASNTADALYALDCGEFDLIAIGVAPGKHEHLAVVPYIHSHYPCYPTVVISKDGSPHDTPPFGVCETFVLPRRASQLKSMMQYIVRHYLSASLAA
jgi:DNA-binding NtrC family response regulator